MMILTTTALVEGRAVRDYLGIDLDYAVIGESGSMLMVSATGTAVRLG